VDANIRLMQEQGKVGVSISGPYGNAWASGLESDFSRWAGYYASDQRSAGNGCGEPDLGVFAFLSAIASMLLLVGGLRVMDGALSIGMLVAFRH